MYLKKSHEEVKTRVAQVLEVDPNQSLTTLSEALDITEGEATFALPGDMMTSVDGAHTEAVLSLLPEWGKVTTIVQSLGSIFEFKNPFPKGKCAHGYYNIMGKEGLHGHLRIDLIERIAFVSKPFMTMESHYIGFYDMHGDCVFKVYLGRDKARNLFPEQIATFMALKEELAA
ncbi:HuvX protein [Vibrio sp. 10N.286.49.B3]|uniref:heme utilization cystosolic carrier protein HutX n=1 Tax=Vibrio sp. 10N.286.49.B3 TaxID=1880855 RepID=UPI000C84B779|nr:heme utilization cystosolic carrier protein HutX [Vibrio sp. 10N.286.49.B3]PMH37105.1 HuvX protein [Vibrio sp. 10N.286.49.B3]